MPSTFERPLLMFSALIALYSPIASVSSYFPVVSRVSRPNQRRLALGVLLYVTIFAQVALWVGEPLLRVLGLTTAALTATGGIALMYAAIPLMRGKVEAETSDGEGAAVSTDGDSLTVVKTTTGTAQSVAVAIDKSDWPEVVGTISGDDTIFIATEDARAQRKLRERLRENFRI